MVALKFVETHNLVAFLEKPKENDGFAQIVDFLNAHPINYALTVNPTIYTSCIKQFWATAKAKTVNGDMQIQALVDGKKVIVTEASVRRDLQLAIENGTEFLPNATIFAELERMGLSQRVLALETTKTNQALEIDSLKRRVKKLEKKKRSRTYRLKILFKVGRSAQVVSSEDEGLGAQEDASKQERKILDLDVDAEVTLVYETQGRNDDNLMFDTGVLYEQEVEVEKVVSTAEVTTASATTAPVDELTLAQTLIEIKAAKPKVVITAATTTTTAVTRPKARGVAKDKGKAKMIEPEKPLKRKDQIMIDEEIAQKLQAQLDAELEEEENLARQREEDANIAEWDNVQAMMDADYELAARLQAQEQEELTIEERSKMFVELMNKRKKHFARLRAEEQRRKPPTKAQKRNTMSTYLKNMAGYKHNQLKTKSFEDIQMLFDKAMTRVNTFVDMDTELVKGSETRTEGSSKRAGEELESKNLKKQKLDENVEAEVDDDQEEAEMKQCIMEIMLQNIERKDLETLWKLVKTKHGLTRPEESYERVLWGDLKVMFEPDVEKKKYLLTSATITEMLSKKLQTDHWNEMCYQLLKLMTKQLKNPGSGRIVGIKRLLDDLGVNTAKVRVTTACTQLMLLVTTAERLHCLVRVFYLSEGITDKRNDKDEDFLRKVFDESKEGITKTIAEPVLEEYITVTRKNYISGNDRGKIVEKSFLEQIGTFLIKIRDNAFSGTNGEDAIEHIKNASSDWFKEECIGLITSWEDLTEKFFGKFYPPSRTNKEMKADEDEVSSDQTDNEFENWLATKFEYYMIMDQDTMYYLWRYWRMESNKEVKKDNEPCIDKGEDSEEENEIAGIFSVTPPNGAWKEYVSGGVTS
ncbi:hypothetical protein Tco_1549559 [Tanacetum coccineum]